MAKTFEFSVNGKKEKLEARDEVQAAAFAKVQKEFKEKAEKKKAAAASEEEK